MNYLIKGGRVVTMDRDYRVFDGDVRLVDGEIAELGASLKTRAGEVVVDAKERFVIPGLVQAHVHLVQTLFRGLADDLELLDWLMQKIWPFESNHDAASIRASAQVGLLEMQLAGTTSILDMGTVRLHEEVFAEAERSGIRYWGGNCLMDKKSMSGPLYRSTEDTLAYVDRLLRDWHRKTPLISYAISPRFAISCTEKILRAAVKLRDRHDLIFHTHASENRGEIELVKKTTGLDNVKYLGKLGALSSRTVLAHGVHLKSGEITDLARTKTGLCHCPSSNLKLASGFAPVHTYRKKGIKVALGADGAPCNNQMDPFVEMRLAALIQKPLLGPTALPARDAFTMATREGAEVLNAADRIGSLEVGKRADVVLVDRGHPSVATVDDPYSALVYSCTGRDVAHAWTDGRLIVDDRRHQIYDAHAVVTNARTQLERLLARLNPAGPKA